MESTPPIPNTVVGETCGVAGEVELLSREQAEDLAAVAKALADPTRIRLVQYLAASSGGTVCACHLPEALGISQSTLSFHTRKLLEAGLVDREQRGRWVHWRLRPEALAPLQDLLGALAPRHTA